MTQIINNFISVISLLSDDHPDHFTTLHNDDVHALPFRLDDHESCPSRSVFVVSRVCFGVT